MSYNVQNGEVTRCSICLSFEIVDPSIPVGCEDKPGHNFCFTCLRTWYKNKPSCPLCRSPSNYIRHQLSQNGSGLIKPLTELKKDCINEKNKEWSRVNTQHLNSNNIQPIAMADCPVHETFRAVFHDPSSNVGHFSFSDHDQHSWSPIETPDQIEYANVPRFDWLNVRQTMAQPTGSIPEMSAAYHRVPAIATSTELRPIINTVINIKRKTTTVPEASIAPPLIIVDSDDEGPEIPTPIKRLLRLRGGDDAMSGIESERYERNQNDTPRLDRLNVRPTMAQPVAMQEEVDAACQPAPDMATSTESCPSLNTITTRRKTTVPAVPIAPPLTLIDSEDKGPKIRPQIKRSLRPRGDDAVSVIRSKRSIQTKRSKRAANRSCVHLKAIEGIPARSKTQEIAYEPWIFTGDNQNKLVGKRALIVLHHQSHNKWILRLREVVIESITRHKGVVVRDHPKKFGAVSVRCGCQVVFLPKKV